MKNSQGKKIEDTSRQDRMESEKEGEEIVTNQSEANSENQE